MDYESRRVKWYWLLLFVIYCSAVGYLLFSGNPYLYSHHELRAALVSGADAQLRTIPSEPRSITKPGPPTAFSRFNFARTAIDPVASGRSRSYEEYERHSIETGIENWSPQVVVGDRAGFYVTDKSRWVVAIDLNGKTRWRYRFIKDPGERGLLAPLVDDAHAYVVHPQGEVIAFDKMKGDMHWLLPLVAEIVAPPFLFGQLLVIPVKAKTGIELVLVDRATGKKLEQTPRLDIKPGFLVSHGAGAPVIIATVDNKVMAIDPETWTLLWSQTLTEPIRGPAVVVDNAVFVSTLGAKIVRLDANRKGKVDWETELEKPAATPPAYLPIMNRLSVVDTSGALLTLDARSGKIYWRYGIEARSTMMDTWSARLAAKNIEENKMDWAHKGWTIWSGCGAGRVCVYTPLKGLLINRLAMTGEPLALPLMLERRMVFFTEVKSGQYMLSHQVEEAEARSLRKAASESREAAVD